MKKLLFIFITLTVSLLVAAQDVAGSWSGSMRVGNQELVIMFHITPMGDGYETTLEVPAQGLKSLKASTTLVHKKNISISIQPIMAWFAGEVRTDSIIGNFSQSGLTYPLALTRGKITINRPQTPQPPFPYVNENVKIKNSRFPQVELAGTLSLPSTTGKFPAVVLISGSGPQNRDEEILAHKPFAVIADYLARNGIAVLRYDDRGIGESTGQYPLATTFDFAIDAGAAFEFLKRRPEIVPSQIGLVGHSEGGTIAFITATEKKEVAFIVSLAGMGVRGDSLLLTQNKELFSQQFNPEIAKVYCQALDEIFATLRLPLKERPVLQDTICNRYKSRLPDALLTNLQKVAKTHNIWLDTFISLDPAVFVTHTKCPVMAINGEKDSQVNANKNLNAIEQALSRSINREVSIKRYSALNHLFQHCKTGNMDEYFKIEETFSPEVLSDITAWIKNNCK